MATVLIVDDDPGIRATLRFIFRRAGHEALDAEDGEAGLEVVRRSVPRVDVAIVDLRMPGMGGLELLKRLKEVDPSLPAIVLTAFSDWDNTVEAMRLGAHDYLKKPFDNENIVTVIERAVARRRVLAGSRGRPELPELRELVGSSVAMRELLDVVARVAPTESTVLIEGESGTGKELVARAIHHASARASEPFVSVNCGAFPESLVESELFGYVKGAFTGAAADKKGLFEAADRGTFFLDEVGELPLSTQTKLLRVLEERRFIPVGSTCPRRVDVRFVCATNRDLAEEVRRGRFRGDLFYRLNVIPIPLPPLRARPDDIPLLAGHFLRKYAKALSREVTGFSAAASAKLERHPWPGNVRELENAIQRAIALARGPVIEDVQLAAADPSGPGPDSFRGDLTPPVVGSGRLPGAAHLGPGVLLPSAPSALHPPPHPHGHSPPSPSPGGSASGRATVPTPAPPAPGGASADGSAPDPHPLAPALPVLADGAGPGAFDLERTLETIERHYLEQALARTEGNLTRAAELLGITFRSIRYKVKKLGIREARGSSAREDDPE